MHARTSATVLAAAATGTRSVASSSAGGWRRSSTARRGHTSTRSVATRAPWPLATPSSTTSRSTASTLHTVRHAVSSNDAGKLQNRVCPSCRWNSGRVVRGRGRAQRGRTSTKRFECSCFAHDASMQYMPDGVCESIAMTKSQQRLTDSVCMPLVLCCRPHRARWSDGGHTPRGLRRHAGAASCPFPVLLVSSRNTNSSPHYSISKANMLPGKTRWPVFLCRPAPGPTNSVAFCQQLCRETKGLAHAALCTVRCVLSTGGQFGDAGTASLARFVVSG